MCYMHSSGIKNQVIHLGNVFKDVPFSAITENFFFFFFWVRFLSVIKHICLILRSLFFLPLILLSAVCIATVCHTGTRSHVTDTRLCLQVGAAANPAPIPLLPPKGNKAQMKYWQKECMQGNWFVAYYIIIILINMTLPLFSLFQ